MIVGKSVKRVDAYEKVTGRARYTDDLLDRDPLIAKVLHSTIANGVVKSMDISEAEKVPGVVKIVTCFDVPDRCFPTAGHPWSTDPHHQDVADRRLLNRRVRLYGDDIAAVIAEDEVAAGQAMRKIKVEYEEYEPLMDVFAAMNGAPLHERYPDNVMGRSGYEIGNYEEAIKEEGLIKVDRWYETPTVQHCHIENPISYAYMEKGRVVVVSSTQIPHIVRRIVGQALGIPWGKVRIIKPYLGGGFGNKQDALYEPLNAYLTTLVGGRCVKMDISREETFVSTRVRHGIKFHIISYTRPDGTFVARELESFSNQGAYASHGHSIAAKGTSSFKMLYRADAVKAEARTIFTNMPSAGAMRGYGIPQITFAMESHVDDIAKAIGMDPYELRMKNRMEQGMKDAGACLENYYDSLGQCMEAAARKIDYFRKKEEYRNQTGPIRRGIGMAFFWYNTGVYPISLEVSSCRMVMNQDGSVQVQVGETEIGQGADTAFSQMAAETLGIPFEDVHIVTTQDTDVTPFGTGAYASRQTYMAGFAIRQTAGILKEKVLNYASYMSGMNVHNLDIADGKIVEKTLGRAVYTLAEVAAEATYSLKKAEHLTAESTYQCKSNALSLGCGFAEVEVDIPLGKVKLLNMINAHDCGVLVNPQLAEAQVHGGMSMAIGFGLSEKLLFDRKTGKPLNNNLLDYKLSTTMDHPDLDVYFAENPEPTHPYGVKSLGEPPAIPGAPAIRNAILNATGVAVDELPLNPHILFKRFVEEGLIGGGK